MNGGKQYKFSLGEKVRLEKFSGEVGSKVTLKDVLVFVNENKAIVGSPFLDATVNATILTQGKEKKVTVFKYKPKKNNRTKKGHRQPYTEILVDGVTFEGKEFKAPPKPKVEKKVEEDKKETNKKDDKKNNKKVAANKTSDKKEDKKESDKKTAEVKTETKTTEKKAEENKEKEAPKAQVETKKETSKESAEGKVTAAEKTEKTKGADKKSQDAVKKDEVNEGAAPSKAPEPKDDSKKDA